MKLTNGNSAKPKSTFEDVVDVKFNFDETKRFQSVCNRIVKRDDRKGSNERNDGEFCLGHRIRTASSYSSVIATERKSRWMSSRR